MAEVEEMIDLCSSEDGEGDEEYDEDEDEEDEFEETEDEDETLSGDDSEWSEGDLMESEMDDDDDDDDDGNGGDDDDSVVNKVIRLLKEGHDLKVLKVEECKGYLRKHGLRLAGTKAVCIERIVEHWRIKDGNGEVMYPQSSFVINCRGDVCKGDTILFTQKVYQKFEKMRRSGKILGTRSVAGKVVKESYGTAKQQHTFTIEVLWSKGLQKLSPLHPLLVKGRNLYRLRTFRQPWADEDDRLKVLSEKHERGAAARKVRDMRKERKLKLACIKREKWQNQCREKKPYQGRTRRVEKEKCAKGHDNPTRSFRQEIRGSHAFGKPKPNPFRGRKNSTERRNIIKPSCSYKPHAYVPHTYATSNVSHHHIPHSNVPNPRIYDESSASNAMGPASFEPQANRYSDPVSHQSRWHRSHHSRHAKSNPSRHNLRELDRFSEMMINNRRDGEAYRRQF